MKEKKLQLFLILLFALILCSSLGVFIKEGMKGGRPHTQSSTNNNKDYTPTYISSHDSQDNPQANVNSTSYTAKKGGTATVYSANNSKSQVIVTSKGQQVLATPTNTINGIPSNQIPSGQEDLYILKSQVVPPVCPACPSNSTCPREEPCPACPPCARCPEPAFECKKVPNYSTDDDRFLPRPVLTDFSQFGM